MPQRGNVILSPPTPHLLTTASHLIQTTSIASFDKTYSDLCARQTVTSSLPNYTPSQSIPNHHLAAREKDRPSPSSCPPLFDQRPSSRPWPRRSPRTRKTTRRRT